MYKPSDSPTNGPTQLSRRLTALSGFALAAATGMLLQLPLGAAAGIMPRDGDRNGSRVAPTAAAPNPKAAGSYQLRCWQYGRLLFEEGPVTLGAETRQAAKLVAIDRQGAALVLTDAGATTCLARPFTAPPNATAAPKPSPQPGAAP